ncbi:hypothetical protein PIB30_050633, partial [Stylosanthes scabra]|nr:hypothetical protein [Stylosanthes scabra]
SVRSLQVGSGQFLLLAGEPGRLPGPFRGSVQRHRLTRVVSRRYPTCLYKSEVPATCMDCVDPAHVFLCLLERWAFQYWADIDLSFGPHGRVRTLPLRGVVIVNHHTPRNGTVSSCSHSLTPLPLTITASSNSFISAIATVDTSCLDVTAPSWSPSCTLPARVLVTSPFSSLVASSSSPAVSYSLIVGSGRCIVSSSSWKRRNGRREMKRFVVLLRFLGRELGIGTNRALSRVLMRRFDPLYCWLRLVAIARGDVNVRPTNVPEDMDWVDDLVLLPQSVMDEELLASFRESHAVCGTVSEESQYELVAPNSEERVCYYNLLHPEERHFIYMVFLYFFYLTQPFSRKKSQWSSFRAREGRLIFTLYEESFHNFKNYYFKLRAIEGVRPFYENERGEYQFRLYWYSGPESPKFDFDDLDETDQEIVTVLSQCCARAPFNTKTLLTRSPSYIQKMTNNSEAYKRMRARKKNQANRLAGNASGSKESPKSTADPVSKVPPPGSESQPVTNRDEFKVPPTPANPSDSATDKSKSKKRKAYGHSYGSVYSPDFDAVGFTNEFIMENSQITMDEAGLKNNLKFIMKAGIKAAGISQALQKKLADCPPTSRAEVDQLKEKLAFLVKEKDEAEKELSGVKSELSKLKKSVKEADQLREKAEAETVELKVKVGTLEVDLAKQKEEYEELEDDSIKSNDNIVENLRLQAKVLVSTLKVHILHPDNYVAGNRIVWCENLLPESEGPFFKDEVAVVGDAEKIVPQSGADDAEKTPPA